MGECEWEKWEKWPASATPYRVALITDPQLVDVHTYKHRGIAMAVTIFYSDIYMKRAWKAIHRDLMPIETYFLGDLLDGGREWTSKFVDEAEAAIKKDPRAANDWDEYREDYWYQQYLRFRKVFPVQPYVPARFNVPGNHDIGFGNGVKLSARNRFMGYFGDPNARWMAGNHTFVTIDGPSLSNDQNPLIYGPPKKFLDELEHAPPLNDIEQKSTFKHDVVAAESPHMTDTSIPPPQPLQHYPTVLLTHVPLYRDPDTDCGPRRHKATEPERSIALRYGYQYQNVIIQPISVDILRKTRARYVFSGDDHDACEVTHMYGPQGRVREWTIKSISWNMGVRIPGFELISLWNPGPGSANTPPPKGSTASDGHEKPASTDSAKIVQGGDETLQSHLCLLPDQIGIFLTYGQAALASVLLLTVWMWITRKRRRAEKETGETVLPIARPPSLLSSSKARRANGTSNGYGISATGSYTSTQVDGNGVVDTEDKYWKPAQAAGKGTGGIVQRMGWFWIVAEALYEFVSIIVVILPVYLFLLWW